MPLLKLYANLRQVAGTPELIVHGEMLRDALNDLVRQYPGLRERLLEGDALRPHVIVTLNGHNLVTLDTAVAERDIIAVFPPIAGGARKPDT